MTTADLLAVIVGAVLAFFWTMQRQLMYFSTADVPTPGEAGLAPVETVSFETIADIRGPKIHRRPVERNRFAVANQSTAVA